ncbi:uncharacterized protein IUM83_18979 [Phytophthora cinnamomi]|uniref:uncharacterized protein n=1 Tax=Phytophthora cinnamomi TaxID=4785 RepID=UPI00355A1117|nr:hypothetical protein IUM83_18979 [Phytophthora cinnamomi]
MSTSQMPSFFMPFSFFKMSAFTPRRSSAWGLISSAEIGSMLAVSAHDTVSIFGALFCWIGLAGGGISVSGGGMSSTVGCGIS